MSEYDVLINKYNALNAGYDQLYPKPMKHANTHANGGTDPITPNDIGAYSKNETDTLLQNKAPAWLVSKSHAALSSLDGVMSAIENDLNIMSNRTATYIGLHFSADVQPFGTTNTIVELYKSSNGYAIAIAYHPLHGIIINRIYGGVWTGWEYLNPPMALGVEYRTTERYLGKPVYAKLVDFGALPNKTSKTVEHGIANISYVINWGGVLANGSTIPLRLYDTETIDGEVSRTSIKIFTTYDRSGWTCRVWMKYTKTTD